MLCTQLVFYRLVLDNKVVLMLGPKLKHKILSSVLFCFAFAVFLSIALKTYEQGAVTFISVSAFGSMLFILAFALIPEFIFLKFSEAGKFSFKSHKEKISEKLFFCGMLLVIIGFVGRVAL